MVRVARPAEDFFCNLCVLRIAFTVCPHQNFQIIWLFEFFAFKCASYAIRFAMVNLLIVVLDDKTINSMFVSG